MRLRVLVLLALSALMGWGGYQASVLRAAVLPKEGEVLAVAGSEPGLFGGGESSAGSETYRISTLNIFSNVALHVKDNYVDPSRIDPKQMLIAALNQVEREVAEVLVEDIGGGRVRISIPGQQKIVTVNDVQTLWEINLKLREVFRFFEKNLPAKKDLRSVEYAAVNGALSTLDPHSVLLKPEDFAEMKTSTKGEFGGLGIVISVRDGKLTIISPLDGTPAARAGLKAMDVIARIGDVSTVSMPIEEAVQRLRGPEGSKVTIWVQRKSWPEPRKFTLTRERIKIESIESRLLEERVGYVKIKNFQQNTGRDLDEHIEKLQKESKGGLRGLVLDLRNNPGGLLEQAIRVSDKFLSSGDIVTTVGYGNKLREPKRAQWSGTDLDLPLAVLVNNGSASASEIVAGALRNLDRAVIVGERTFGKGSVQVLYDFADNSALKLTIAQYLTPGGISIQNVGVPPDIELSPALLQKDLVRLYYEPEAHREARLDKHLDTNSEGTVEESTPEFKLTYLVEPDKKEEDAQVEAAEDEESEVPPPDGFKEDYAIRLSRQLLAAAGGKKRSDTMRGGRTLLQQRAQEEQQKITAAIQAFGVDWSAVPSTAATKPAIAADLKLKGTTTDGRISAGSEVTIEATVTNAGPSPVARVHGHLDTEHGSFRGREFLFGTLAPGQSRSWSITTRIPREAASRSDILTLKLATDQSPLDGETRLPVMTAHVSHPRFAYSYEIDDAERGDGDGILERGEGVDFVIFVSNVGNGDAEKVSLKLKSGAGEDLFLERGRADIGAIKGGETKIGRLRFKVRPNQSEDRDRLPLELTIIDQSTQEYLEDQFAVVAETPAASKLTKKKGSGVSAQDTLVLAAARKGAPVLATLAKGAPVTYGARVDDYLRVDLDAESFGWVAASDVRSGRAAKKPTEALVKYFPARVPPDIHIDGQLGGRVVDVESVVLSGNITGRDVRDMYVLLNDKKVLYSAAPAVAPTASADPNKKHTIEGWEPPDDRTVRLTFQQTLPLKDGLNRILIVARLDDHVLSYRNLFVSRIPRVEPAVAEAVKGPATVEERRAPR
ncbi:MAG: PDZ domain-containing protein [Deltaproteobacteria bacterium]|nr:PDZ domain-containing protein [Deltaproteobacteria bacterium]